MKSLFVLVASAILQLSCSRKADEPRVAPEVHTLQPEFVGNTRAFCRGEVRNEGSAKVTSRGFCYDVFPMPTLATRHTSGTGGSGSFTDSLRNLDPQITYYVRAYAVSEHGTSYGGQVSFVTPNTWKLVRFFEQPDDFAVAPDGFFHVRNGLLRRSPNGMFWMGVNIPTPSAQRVYQLGNESFVVLYDGLYRSTDNGESWHRCSWQVPAGSNIYLFAESNGDILGCNNEDIYMSRNRGADWQLISSKVVKNGFRAGCASQGRLYVIDAYGMSRSDDNGVSWSPVTIPSGMSSLMDGGDRLFAYGNGVYYSTDGGASWTACTVAHGMFTSMTRKGTSIYALNFMQGVVRSADGGHSWTEISDGLSKNLSMSHLRAGENALYLWQEHSLMRLSE